MICATDVRGPSVCIQLSFCPGDCLFASFLFFILFVFFCLFFLFVCLFACLFVCLFACLLVCLFVCLFVCFCCCRCCCCCRCRCFWSLVVGGLVMLEVPAGQTSGGVGARSYWFLSPGDGVGYFGVLSKSCGLLRSQLTAETLQITEEIFKIRFKR